MRRCDWQPLCRPSQPGRRNWKSGDLRCGHGGLVKRLNLGNE